LLLIENLHPYPATDGDIKKLYKKGQLRLTHGSVADEARKGDSTETRTKDGNGVNVNLVGYGEGELDSVRKGSGDGNTTLTPRRERDESKEEERETFHRVVNERESIS
jgi:hypothetical protein